MKHLSFLDHVIELRKRVVEYLVVLLLATVLSFVFIKRIIFSLTRLIDGPLVTLAPQEGIVTVMKVGVMLGFLLSLPFFIFQIWRFVSYALNEEQRAKVKYYFFLSFFLFVLGISLAYFIVLPLGLEFLTNYGKEFFNPMISISAYVSFVTSILFLFGVIFQLPLVILFLNSVGIISKKQLREKRRYFYLVAFIIAAFLTPPDVITQIFLAVPIILLYEISYLIILFRG